MNKNALILLRTALLSLCFLAAVSPYASAQYSGREKNAAHNLVWEEKLSRHIEFLSDSICAGRRSGTPGSSEAAFHIIRSFKAAGLLPINGTYARRVYAGNGVVGHNIIGMVPGSKKYPCDSYVIVGAHYDNFGILDGKMFPGADANASGTTALMTIADMFSSMKTYGKSYGRNIIFVAFDAKEMNMAGSYSLWKEIEEGRLSDPITGKPITKDKISLMVNIEQIGCSLSPLKSGRRDYIIMLGSESLHRFDRNLLSVCNRFYDIGLELSYTYYGSENFSKMFYRLSDQRVFVDNGVPAVFFTSGITMNTNKTTDVADTIALDVLRKRIILIYHWIEKMLF